MRKNEILFIKFENFSKNITYVAPGYVVDEDGFALQFVNCDHGTGAAGRTVLGIGDSAAGTGSVGRASGEAAYPV